MGRKSVQQKLPPWQVDSLSFPIPQFIVIGKQSVGKSRLIEVRIWQKKMFFFDTENWNDHFIDGELKNMEMMRLRYGPEGFEKITRGLRLIYISFFGCTECCWEALAGETFNFVSGTLGSRCKNDQKCNPWAVWQAGRGMPLVWPRRPTVLEFRNVPGLTPSRPVDQQRLLQWYQISKYSVQKSVQVVCVWRELEEMVFLPSARGHANCGQCAWGEQPSLGILC